MTAAEDKFCDIILNLKKKGMILNENCLPADNSHEISYLFCYFLKKQQNLKVSSAANCRWRFMG